jgi:uncharacterized protein YqcC (DUF446 family)
MVPLMYKWAEREPAMERSLQEVEAGTCHCLKIQIELQETAKQMTNTNTSLLAKPNPFRSPSLEDSEWLHYVVLLYHYCY